MIKIAYDVSLFWETAKLNITKIKQKLLIWSYNIQVEIISLWRYSLSWLKEKVYYSKRFLNATSSIMPVVRRLHFPLNSQNERFTFILTAAQNVGGKMAAIQKQTQASCLRIRQEDFKSNNCVPTFLSTKLLCFLQTLKYKFRSNK